MHLILFISSLCVSHGLLVVGEEGALKGLKPGSVIIDMTTSSPRTAVELYRTAREKYRVYSLDAPVSGGKTVRERG